MNNSNLITTNLKSMVKDSELLANRRPRNWDEVSDTDKLLVTEFLKSKSHAQATLRRYFRTITQFIIWLDKPLSLLTTQDLRLYQSFMASPTQAFQDLPELAFRDSSTKTVDDHFDVLKSFCNYLINDRVLDHNPSANIKKHNRGSSGETINYFKNWQWKKLTDYINDTQPKTPSAIKEYERLRYCFYLQYGLALRPNELVTHTQADIYYCGEIEGQNIWKISITGKGSKLRDLTLPSLVTDAIARYNRHLGLPTNPQSLPIPLAPTINPIVYKKDSKRKYYSAKWSFDDEGRHFRKSMSTRQWNDIYKTLMLRFFCAIQKIPFNDNTTSNPAWQKQWRQLTPHGLRHTRLTHLVSKENWNVFEVMKYAGHTNINTTQAYFHLNLDGI